MVQAQQKSNDDILGLKCKGRILI